MPGIDKAAGRMAALITLLLLAGAALRGYIPAAGRPAGDRGPAATVALVPLAVLLGVSVVVIAVAVVTRKREPRRSTGHLDALSTGARGAGAWPNWRMVLIALAVICGWLITMWLVTRFAGGYDFGVRAGFSDIDTGGPTPGDAGSSGTVEPPPRRGEGGDSAGYLAAGTMLLLAAAVSAVAMVAARVRRERCLATSVARERGSTDRHGLEPNALARATELGLAQVGDPARDPRTAIIGCYATMEHELARVPGAVPQAFDTPTEVLARAVDHGVLVADNATRLVTLFAEARFSTHRMDETHRDEAIRILRDIHAELRSRA